MKTEHNVRLTSAEIAYIWANYMNDTMAKCILSYYLEKVEDSEVEPVLHLALGITNQHIKLGREILEGENAAIPQGFTDQDVHLRSRRLFSDVFFLHYLKHMARAGLKANSLGLSLAARSDVIDFYNKALADTAELNNKTMQVLLSKGLFVRAPYIPVPEKVDFVKKQSFLAGIWKEPDRPLLGIEIASIYGNIQTNGFGKALLMGFRQVASSEKVRKFMDRGIGIATKETEVLHEFLLKSDLPTPMTWDGDVMDSTEAPFSDKLMMFHISGLNAIGIGDYGDSLGTSMRADLSTSYARFIAECTKYAEDGANLMIDNGWLEQPPQAVNRKALSNA